MGEEEGLEDLGRDLVAGEGGIEGEEIEEGESGGRGPAAEGVGEGEEEGGKRVSARDREEDLIGRVRGGGGGGGVEGVGQKGEGSQGGGRGGGDGPASRGDDAVSEIGIRQGFIKEGGGVTEDNSSGRDGHRHHGFGERKRGRLAANRLLQYLCRSGDAADSQMPPIPTLITDKKKAHC